MLLKKLIENKTGQQLKQVALNHLEDGINSLQVAKKHFEAYADTVKQRKNNAEELEDFAEVSEVSQEDTAEVIRSLNELILMMRMSSPAEDDIFDADEIEKQVIYKRK